MSVINLEILNGQAVCFGHLPGGDVEVRLSRQGDVVSGAGKIDGPRETRGYLSDDSVIMTIPKNRRNLLADFLRIQGE